MAKAPTVTLSRDDLEVYQRGGALALNELWYPNPELFERELQRMERPGYWKVEWPDGGHGCIVHRLK